MTGAPWASSGLEVLRTADFDGERLDRAGTYVVCFGAEWCPVTRRFVPKFVARRDEFDGRLAIADITDREDPLWDRFHIRITPSILVFRDGAVHARTDGRPILGVTRSDLDNLQEAFPSVPSRT
jgi:hypothetical protein